MRHRPLYSVGALRTIPQILNCGGGWRMMGTSPNVADNPKRVLIVDDTAWHGDAMDRVRRLAARRWPEAQILTAVIYAHPQAVPLLDYAACSYAGLHYLEWNLFNSSHLDPAYGYRLVSDLDGIFCRDIALDDDDDGPRYLAAIRNALPIQRPNRRPVAVIVAARLEKYRSETEAWFRRVGIRGSAFIMGPWRVAPRAEPGLAGERPPPQVRSLPRQRIQPLRGEATPSLARRTHERTSKSVLCPQLARVLTEAG